MNWNYARRSSCPHSVAKQLNRFDLRTSSRRMYCCSIPSRVHQSVRSSVERTFDLGCRLLALRTLRMCLLAAMQPGRSSRCVDPIGCPFPAALSAWCWYCQSLPGKCCLAGRTVPVVSVHRRQIRKILGVGGVQRFEHRLAHDSELLGSQHEE